MKLHKARRSFGTEINIAPLIDVVFLLIIFFMTVSQITKMEVEPVTLPEAAKGEAPKELATGRVIVNVLEDGRIVVAGQPCTPQALRGLLAQEVKQRGSEEVVVLVRGDREAPWRQAAAVLQACGANGIGQVRVAVIEPQAGGAKP